MKHMASGALKRGGSCLARKLANHFGAVGCFFFLAGICLFVTVSREGRLFTNRLYKYVGVMID